MQNKYSNNNLTDARNIYLAVGMAEVTNAPVELDMWNFLWRQIITIPTDSVQNILYAVRVTNMMAVRTLLYHKM